MFYAYQIEEHQKPLQLRQLKKPTPTDHQVLIKTRASGVCHSDVHIVSGDWGACKLPLTPGHEGIGIVEAVGSSVSQVKVGDRVGMAFLNHSCLNCHLCGVGRQNICEKQNQSGFTVDGSFAEYFIGDERFVVKIPDNYSDAEAAPILCAGITSYKAVLSANAKPGARIVISGACGGLGHLAIQYAKALGYEVVALDFYDDNQDKENMCRKLGADFLVHLTKENNEKTLLQEFEQLLPHKPIEAAIVFAPVAAAVSDAVSYVSPGGTIVPVGIPSGDFKISPLKLILKELKVQGSIVGTPSDLKVFLFSSKHNIKPRVEEREMKYVNDVIQNLKNGKISGRVVLTIK